MHFNVKFSTSDMKTNYIEQHKLQFAKCEDVAEFWDRTIALQWQSLGRMWLHCIIK